MATMITNECISCGACEPECPNNAISQGETIYVIDPKLCTECVGFHDYEACAAVCPVDCCVTDPNNVETEETLIARARALHPDVTFGDNFPSRFRKGQGGSPAKPPAKAAAAAPAAGDGSAASSPPSASPSPSAPPEPEVEFVPLPPVDSWTIPIRCFKCGQVHVEPVGSFVIGNVIFCPHCNKSMVVGENLNYHIRTLLEESYERWEREQREFQARREKEWKEFLERRAREARAFEAHQRDELEKLRRQLEAIGESYDAPGKPLKKGSRFAWG
ncbi:MAG TPA: YfhL family 4Fe-4S dicluster ferredoxin [candidate division Zixibacteria bacterium]|nr:YfhL family 4Fe-4S dicluster ferredoxin [candidate division Zixibacteria bacterium]